MNKKEFAMYNDKYFVVLIKDEPPTGYRIKVAPVSIGSDGKIRRSGFSRWADAEKVKKLTPEVVDIMVASNAV